MYLGLSDSLIVGFAWTLSVWFALQTSIEPAWLLLTMGSGLLAAVLWWSSKSEFRHWRLREVAVKRLFLGFVVLASTLLASLWLMPSAQFLMLVWAIGCGTALFAARGLIVMMVKHQTEGRGPVHRVAISQSNEVSASEIAALRQRLSDGQKAEVCEACDLRQAVLDGHLDEIVLFGDTEFIKQQGKLLRSLPVDITVGVRPTSPTADLTDGGVIELRLWRRMPLGRASMFLKRIFDMFLASMILIVLLPLLMLIALAIRVTSPGPILFCQNRTGLFQHPFKIYKFRSLYVEDQDLLSLKQAHLNDPRITSVGWFLRATSLDELPQLVNVVCGQMALVGPRPHAPMTGVDGELFEDLLIDYPLRHCVRPGLTGLAQINGCRGPVDSVDALERRLHFDLAYITNWSWREDLMILLKSLGVPFSPLRSQSTDIDLGEPQLRQES